MTLIRNSLLITSLVTHSLLGFAQTPQSTVNANDIDPTLTVESDEPPQLVTPIYTTAQLLPAYKIGLKKGMFEIMGGIGHIDGSVQNDRGQSAYITKTPQTDYFPVQLAYGLGDNTNISFSGKASRKQDKVANTSYEGTSEPQLTVSHTFRNENSAINIIGTYTADVGPQTNTSIGATRTEGNTLAGGASAELTSGYFLRLDPVIIGGEASYLYKDSRIVNRETIALFTGQSTGQTQTRLEGGHEKTLRGIVELALPFRVGMIFGRTWVEQEEELFLYQLTPNIHDSYYRNFVSGYGRIQVNPRLSVLPSLSYSNAPDTSDATSKNDREISTQVNLRFRF